MNKGDFDYYASFSMADRSRSRIWFDAIQRRSSSQESLNVVEVGVGQGGRIALAALALRDERKPGDTRIIGFDRFENPLDFGQLDSQFAGWAESFAVEAELSRVRLPFADSQRVWMKSVQELCESTGYRGNFDLIAGDVETEAGRFVASCDREFRIDVLSISCNWYSGVRASLEWFFPILSPRAFVMLDGYFYWEGYRKACHEHGIDEAYPGAFRCGDCLVLDAPLSID